MPLAETMIEGKPSSLSRLDSSTVLTILARCTCAAHCAASRRSSSRWRRYSRVDVGGHRAVQVDRHVGNPPLGLERGEQWSKVCARATAKDGISTHAAARGGAMDDARPASSGSTSAVQAVAVGGLDHHAVARRRRRRRLHQQVVAAAEVAGEQHRAARRLDARAGGAEDVAGAAKAARESPAPARSRRRRRTVKISSARRASASSVTAAAPACGAKSRVGWRTRPPPSSAARVRQQQRAQIRRGPWNAHGPGSPA